jgi:hypothetical protein
MLGGMKTGKVEMKAIRPEMKRIARAYDVFVGSGLSCDLGLERKDR